MRGLKSANLAQNPLAPGSLLKTSQFQGAWAWLFHWRLTRVKRVLSKGHFVPGLVCSVSEVTPGFPSLTLPELCLSVTHLIYVNLHTYVSAETWRPGSFSDPSRMLKEQIDISGDTFPG